MDVVEPGIPTFVLGDFNTVFERAIDRRGSDPLDDSHESSLALRKFFTKCCVVNIWRDLHPLTPGFSWESPDHARASRIDLIGCPAVWAPFVSFCNFVPCPFSDHSVVHLSISPPVLIQRGPGRWKCNILIMEDPELRSEIESFWIYWRTRQPFFPSVGKGKKVIKSLISHHCSSKASKKRQELDLLTRLASHLEEKLDAGMTSVAEPLESVLLSIADMNRTAAVGARVRASCEMGRRGGVLFKIFLSPREETWGGSVVLRPPHGGWHHCFRYQRYLCRVVVFLFIIIFCRAHRSWRPEFSPPAPRVHSSG